jgi:hypothetical protein
MTTTTYHAEPAARDGLIYDCLYKARKFLEIAKSLMMSDDQASANEFLLAGIMADLREVAEDYEPDSAKGIFTGERVTDGA